MMKKIIAMMLSVCLALGSVPQTVNAVDNLSGNLLSPENVSETDYGLSVNETEAGKEQSSLSENAAEAEKEQSGLSENSAETGKEQTDLSGNAAEAGKEQSSLSENSAETGKEQSSLSENSAETGKEQTDLSGNTTSANNTELPVDEIKENTEGEQLTAGVAITGLEASDERYPALRQTDGSYLVTYIPGLTYEAMGETSPETEYEAANFTWTSSDTAIVKVTDGVMEPLKEGKAIIKVTPKEGNVTYLQKELTLPLEVRKMPTMGTATIYAAAGSKTKLQLKQIPFSEKWEKGWKWKQENTVVYSLPAGDTSYVFDAVFTGDNKYPYEKQLTVHLATVTAVHVTEIDGAHNRVLQADGTDTLRLQLGAEIMGDIPGLEYRIPKVKNLEIVQESDDVFTIQAEKEGTYTIKPEICWNQTVICKGSYTIKAVNQEQAAAIEISSDTPGITLEDGKLILDWSEEWKEKEITLKAAVKDSEGSVLEHTKLNWKVSNTKTASVKAGKAPSREAVLKPKGEGHALLTVTAKDAAAYTETVEVYIRNHSPRLSRTKVTVNRAYDYRTAEGRELAAENGGVIELTGVYGRKITSVRLLQEDGKTLLEGIELIPLEESADRSRYLFQPANSIENQTYKAILAVTVEGSDKEYSYELNLRVEERLPKVKAAMSGKIDLFYKTKPGTLTVSITGGNKGIENITWKDSSGDVDNSFEIRSMFYDWKGKLATDIFHDKVEVTEGKLSEPEKAIGTLTVKLYGIKDAIEIQKFKIGYTYKKPKLASMSATTSVVPETGNNSNKFWIQEKSYKNPLSYGENDYFWYYDTMECDSKDVEFTTRGSYVYYEYKGTAAKEKLTFTLDSPNWREPLEMTHTVKTVKPKVKLSEAKLVYNLKHKSQLTTRLMLSENPGALAISQVTVTGGDSKTQKLLSQGVMKVTIGGEEYTEIGVSLHPMNLSGEELKTGTYTIAMTPDYLTKENGEQKSLNTVKLKITIINQPVSVKVSTKGSLDLAKGKQQGQYENSVKLTPTFKNLGSDSELVAASLEGGYSRYFTLLRTEDGLEDENIFYLKINPDDEGKLRAKQSYALTIEYLFETEAGIRYTVDGSFKVTPKQSQPKVTIGGNSPILYASSDGTRTATISVPFGYELISVTGALDVNKDKKTDIQVSLLGEPYGYPYLSEADIEICLLQPAAVPASATGKKYKVPLTVILAGSDGVSKHASATLTVEVRN